MSKFQLLLTNIANIGYFILSQHECWNTIPINTSDLSMYWNQGFRFQVSGFKPCAAVLVYTVGSVQRDQWGRGLDKLVYYTNASNKALKQLHWVQNCQNRQIPGALDIFMIKRWSPQENTKILGGYLPNKELQDTIIWANMGSQGKWNKIWAIF